MPIFETEYIGKIPCEWTIYTNGTPNATSHQAKNPLFSDLNTEAKSGVMQPATPQKYRNIFTATYFKLYRPVTDTTIQTLENAKNYLTGLDNMITECKKFFPTNKFRIYCDHNSIDDLLARYEADPYVELYKYYMPDFIDPETRYHYGYIGTIMRFLPFFDLPLHKVDTAICLDIDDSMNFQLRRMINDCIRNRLTFAYRSAYCYSLMPRVSSKSKYGIIASFIYVNAKYLNLPADKLLAPYFWDCLLRNTCSDYSKWLDTHPSSFIHTFQTQYNTLPYGVDEYFLNNRVLPYLKTQGIPYYPIFTSLDIRRFIKLISITIPEQQLTSQPAEFAAFIAVFRRYLEPVSSSSFKLKHKQLPASILDHLDYIHSLAGYEAINKQGRKFADELYAAASALQLPDRLLACLHDNLDFNFGDKFHFIIKKVVSGDSTKYSPVIHKTAKGLPA